ncbi:MAG: radical SAM protein [Anaerolineales bacterium]|jgi:predicted DNA-binding helix-hairpin-helix protein
MDTIDRLALAAQGPFFEQDGSEQAAVNTACAGRRPTPGETAGVEFRGHAIPVYQAATPGGKRFPLLKAMLTTACERSCRYCAFRAGRDMRRVTLKPEEMAQVFFDAQRAGIVSGLFLSTGIFAGGPNTQNKLLDCAEILRRKLSFRGYLHLKLMPGVERDQVQRAMELADRVSVNLEAPNPKRLEHLAPEKDFTRELLAPLRWAEQIRQERSPEHAFKGTWASTTTQFVVGAAGESDLELLSTVERLFRGMKLRRTYFEAFSPVEDTPLENHPAESVTRQQRLYEASYLLRDYGFDLEELPFDAQGKLPLERDPKRCYADEVLRQAPVDLNRAEPGQLLRVPGIGPKGCERIVRARRERRLVDLSQLRGMGILAERAAPYILLDGRLPAQQLPLFAVDP